MTTMATTFQSYGTEIPTVSSTAFQETSSTTTDISTETSSTIETTSTTTDTPGSTATSTTSDLLTSTATSTTSSAPTASATYAQILTGGVVAKIPWSNFANSDFDTLCPSNDCLQDCQNYTRLFEEVPYPFTDSVETYGQSINGHAPNTTLFGVCTNLGSVFAGISQAVLSDSTASFFPSQNQSALTQVSSTLASCLTSTCDASREPQNCDAACNMQELYADGANTNLTAVTACLNMICGNTCGLPYADQDVMGVGVLVSYVIQAILVLGCAVLLLWSASRHIFRTNKTKDLELSEQSRDGLEAFLVAQCYYTIALEIAALCSSPWNVDPLNGYALLSVSITGFLCPVFTLMLLHSHGMKSIYCGLLTVLSYILSTIVFWMLYSNLSRHLNSTTASDEALRTLYQLPSCGGSSAIALCPQTIGNDPLHYLAGFYNKSGVPNLHTMPLLWGWTTLILLLVLTDQILQTFATKSTAHQTSPQSPSTLFTKVLTHPITLLLSSTIFTLCLVYQAEMLRRYSGSDVIDWHGWTFGQVVAVVVWVQPIADYLHGVVKKAFVGDEADVREKNGYTAVRTGATPATTPLMRGGSTFGHSPSNSVVSQGYRAVSPAQRLSVSHTY